MDRPVRWYDYITINIYFFGLTMLSQGNGLIQPLLVQQFVGEANKATYYGAMRMWTLMVALLMQALMGMLSDRSTLRWGRRRPFIFIGTLFNAAFVFMVGFLIGFEGMTGFVLLFILVIFQQIASNTAHGAEQGLIPDLVPESRRGLFSGVKTILEVPLPLILVSFTVGKLVGKGNLWAGIIIVVLVLIVSMLITMLAPEKRLAEKPPALDWAPFLRLVAMTVIFTVIILGMGEVVRQVTQVSFDLSPLALSSLMGLLGMVAMAVAVVVGVLLSVRISIGESAARNSGRNSDRNSSFTWWIINRLAFLVGTANLSTFAVYFFQARLGYVREKAAGPASMLMMFVGVCILFSALPSGWLADRFGRKRLVGLSGLIAALGTFIIVLVPNLTVIYVGGSIVGIATGLFFTTNWALGTDLAPKQEAGRYLGLSNLAGAGAGAVGSYIGGPIADFFTRQVPEAAGLGFVLLFAIYGAMFLLSVLALTQVKGPKVA